GLTVQSTRLSNTIKRTALPRRGGVQFNDFGQILGTAIMEEKQALPCSPQRRCTAFARPSLSLGHAVSQGCAHVMDGEIRERVKGRVIQVFEVGGPGSQGGGMVLGTTGRFKGIFPIKSRCAERQALWNTVGGLAAEVTLGR